MTAVLCPIDGSTIDHVEAMDEAAVGRAFETAQAAADDWRRTAPHLRGRVMALYLMVFMGGTPLGSPFIGWLGQQFGARWTLIGGGGLTLLGVLLSIGLFLRARAGLPRADADVRTGSRETIGSTA